MRPLGLALGLTAGLALAPSEGARAGGPTTYDVTPLLQEPYPLARRGASGRTTYQGSPATTSTATAASEPGAAPTDAPELSPFNASRDRWYVAGTLGLVIPGKADARGTSTTRINFRNGGSFGGSVGYAWRNGFRLEGQVWYQLVGAKTMNVQSAGQIAGLSTGNQDADGQAKALFFTANVAYDIELEQRWTPYVLAGVGLAQIKYDNISASGGPVVINDSATMAAFQVGAGVGYILTDHVTVDAGYRYAFMLDPTFADTAGDAVESEYGTHNVVFSVRYGF